MALQTSEKALAARDAHEALLELKKLVDDAAKVTQVAEVESFRAAVTHSQDDDVRKSLQDVVDRLNSPEFDGVVRVVREKLETAVSR